MYEADLGQDLSAMAVQVTGVGLLLQVVPDPSDQDLGGGERARRIAGRVMVLNQSRLS